MKRNSCRLMGFKSADKKMKLNVVGEISLYIIINKTGDFTQILGPINTKNIKILLFLYKLNSYAEPTSHNNLRMLLKFSPTVITFYNQYIYKLKIYNILK